MQNLVNDFNLFLGMIFGGIKSTYNWFLSTEIGEIFIFVIIISLFFFLINLFVDFKD